MYLKLLGLLIIATVIKTESNGDVHKDVDYYAHPKYTFSYGVEDFKTGDYKMHEEERNGDGVKGEYRVADPNGSIRTVTYTADKKHGFKAVVKQSEPTKTTYSLKENQDAIAEHRQNEESASAQYNYYHDRLFTQSEPYDSQKKTVLKYTPSVYIDKYVEKFPENLAKKDKMQMQEIQKSIYPYNQQFQSNQQETIKSESEMLKRTGITKNINIKQIELVKQNSKMEQLSSSYVQKQSPKLNAVKPQDGNIAQQFKIQNLKLENQYYYPSGTEQLYYVPQHMEKPETQSTYFPEDFQANNGLNFKHNAIQKPSSFQQNSAELKQSVSQLYSHNSGYAEAAKEDYPQLFQQPQTMINQDFSKKIEDYKPAYSYQSVINGKSLIKSKVTTDTSINNQAKSQLYYTQQKLRNGQKTNILKTQGEVKYNELSENNQFKVMHKAQKQPIYSQQIYNIKGQEDYLAYPQQNIVYGKYQENQKITHGTGRSQQYETLINKQGNPTMQNAQKQHQKENVLDEEMPAFSYQTIINRQKPYLSKTQEEAKYYQAKKNQEPVFYFKQDAEQQLDQVPHIYNVDAHKYESAFPYQSITNGKVQENSKITKNIHHNNLPQRSIDQQGKQPLNYQRQQQKQGLFQENQKENVYKSLSDEQNTQLSNDNYYRVTENYESPKLELEHVKKQPFSVQGLYIIDSENGKSPQFQDYLKGPAHTYYNVNLPKPTGIEIVDNQKQVVELKNKQFDKQLPKFVETYYKPEHQLHQIQIVKHPKELMKEQIFHNEQFEQKNQELFSVNQDILKHSEVKPENPENGGGIQKDLSKVTLDNTYKPQYGQYKIQSGIDQPLNLHEYSQENYQPYFSEINSKTHSHYKDLPTFQFQQTHKH